MFPRSKNGGQFVFVLSVILSSSLKITFEQWVIELYYFTWIFPVIRPFHYFCMKKAQLTAVVVYENPENLEHWAELFLSRYDFMKSIKSWISKLLFSIQGCTLDDLVWFILLEHLKTTPPWPRERERSTISPLQPSTGQGKLVESSPFCLHHYWTMCLLQKKYVKKKSMDLQILQKWGSLRRIFFL